MLILWSSVPAGIRMNSTWFIKKELITGVWGKGTNFLLPFSWLLLAKPNQKEGRGQGSSGLCKFTEASLQGHRGRQTENKSVSEQSSSHWLLFKLLLWGVYNDLREREQNDTRNNYKEVVLDLWSWKLGFQSLLCHLLAMWLDKLYVSKPSSVKWR